MANVSSRLITALAFAFPGAVFAWCITDGQGPAMWQWVPVSAGIGTFVTAMVVWPWIAREETSRLRCSIAGGAVGMLAHPVTAVVLIVVMSTWTSFGLLPPLPQGRAPWPTSIGDMLQFAAFVMFWWCLLAIVWVGWVTAAIGAILGFLFALVRRWTTSRRGCSQPANELGAALLSLVVTAGLTGVGLATCIVLRVPPPPQDVVVRKSTPNFDGEPALIDVSADVLTGATLIGYEDSDGDLSWTFSEERFEIAVGESGVPPELMYELGLPSRDVERIHGDWSVDGQQLFLTNIQVDGNVAEQQEVALGTSYRAGALHIHAGGQYEFRPGFKNRQP